MASHHGESDGTADSIPTTNPTIINHDDQGQPSTGESAGSVPDNTSSAPEMEAGVSDLSINDAPAEAEAEAEAEATESSSSTIDVASPLAPPSPPPAPTPPSPPTAPAALAPPTPPAAPAAPSPPAPAAPTPPAPTAPPAQPTPSEEPTAATTASTTTTTETTTSSEQPTSQGSTTSQPARPHYRPASPPLPPIPAEWQRSSSPRRPPVPPPAPLPPYPVEFTVGANSSRGTRSQQRRPSAAGSGTNARRTSSAFEAIPEPPLPPAPPVPRPQPQEPRQRRQDYPLPPRWQPDSEVTYCPICHQQFSIFVRKHHCRKCGRVVCNSCSPHRITIPYQYIVLPPGSQPYQMQTAGSSTDPSSDMTFLGGGERVRLCNPCVPDPNTAPPALASALSGAGSSNRYHSRSFSSANSSTIQSAAAAGGGTYHFTQSGQAPSSLSSRFVEDSPNLSSYATARPSGTSAAVSSMASATTAAAPSSSSSSQNRYRHNRLSLPPMPAVMASAQEQQLQLQLQLHHNQQQQLQQQHQAQQRHSHSHSHSHRSRPPQPQIAEEDECPICHRELPKRSLPNFETLREAHITECLETHSRYMGGSPSTRNAAGSSPASGAADPSNTSTSLPTSAAEASSSTAAPPPPRRTGVFPYTATEKDCVDDAECTICLEELEVSVRMARLECFCRFHEHCIRAWFKGHPGRCPVHQHDSFGY